jgi:hypothetical protein
MITNTTFQSKTGLTTPAEVLGFDSPYCQPSDDFCLSPSSIKEMGYIFPFGDYYFFFRASEKNTELLTIKNERTQLFDLFLDYLSFDDISKARTIIQKALKLYPEDKDFIMAAMIISPPELKGCVKSDSEGIKETIIFLKSIDNRFYKKWIAVSKGKLLAVSTSYKYLVDNFNDKDVFITKVV